VLAWSYENSINKSYWDITLITALASGDCSLPRIGIQARKRVFKVSEMKRKRPVFEKGISHI